MILSAAFVMAGSVCYLERSRDILVFRPRARDSSTSLGMTEQIAGYASHGSREDQSFAESSRPSQRWLSRNRDVHRADFALLRDQDRAALWQTTNRVSVR